MNFYEETLRSLTGVLLATAAHVPTAAAFEQVQQVAELLAPPGRRPCR